MCFQFLWRNDGCRVPQTNFESVPLHLIMKSEIIIMWHGKHSKLIRKNTLYYNLFSVFLPIFAITRGVSCVISKLYRFAMTYSAAEVMSSWHEYNALLPITVAVRFKAWAIFACSNVGVMSSFNSRHECCVFINFFFQYVVWGFATDSSPRLRSPADCV
jgi:hypothetical protein